MKHTRNFYHYEIRKCKQAEDSIKKNKLLNLCINGGGGIFEEVRKLRKAGDKEELIELKESIESKVKLSHIEDVEKVTPAIVEEATNNLRNSKTDPVFDFDSDCLMHPLYYSNTS